MLVPVVFDIKVIIKLPYIPSVANILILNKLLSFKLLIVAFSKVVSCIIVYIGYLLSNEKILNISIMIKVLLYIYMRTTCRWKIADRTFKIFNCVSVRLKSLFCSDI